MSQICILTPAAGYKEHHAKEAVPLTALFGANLHFRPWNDAGDLSGFDLILPLLAWGYQQDPANWYAALDAWETQQLHFANPVALLRWNTDKGYLFDLEAAGLDVVPTRTSMALSTDDLVDARATFGADTLVIKPTISGGADGTYLLKPDDVIPEDVLGVPMLIQPMMAAIATEGEYSLFAFDGQISHAILKRPSSGDFRVQEQFGGRDDKVAPPEDAVSLALATLAALPAMPLYARIDMVRDDHGTLRLMELEVIEPSLFLHHAGDAGKMFAACVRGRLG
jgi:hypothetical protein